MNKETGAAIGVIGILGLVLIVCSTLWQAFGETVTVEGNKALVTLSLVFQYGMWGLFALLGLGAICAIIFYIVLPSLGNFLVNRAEAREIAKNASRDVLQGFGGSEYLVRHYPSGQMTVYNPVENLVNLIASGGIDHVLAEAIGRIIHPLPASKVGRIEQNYASGDGVPLLSEPLPRLTSLLPKAQRILIAGGQNSGKTTVCQWIAYYKLQAGRVIVIDSHATPSRWPKGCEVIGAAQNYEAIENLLRWLIAEMKKRFEDQATGKVPERGHEIITIVSDEWTLLPEVIKDVGRYTGPLLTETRKAGFDFYLAAHDTGVEALGISGKGGLRKAFDFAVLCDYDIRTDERHTYVNFMKAGRVSEKDNIEYEPLGPFIIETEAAPVHPILDMPSGEVWDFSEAEEESLPEGEESHAIAAFEEVRDSGEFSWSKATQAAFGPGKFGKNYMNKLKRILDKFHIDYSAYV